MRFIWPQYLWLLAIVPLLVAAYVVVLRRRKPSAVRYADLGLVKAAIGPAQRVRRHLPPALFLLALLAVLLAVARPTAVVTLPSDSRTVLLVMDVSLSMRATDVDPNRMVAAQAAAKQFVRDLPSDIRAGIITFAGTALLVAPPTKNRENLVEAIDRFEMQRHTAIGSGMILALATLFPDEGIDLEQVVFGNNWGSRETSRKSAERDKPLKAPEKKEVKPVPPGTFTSAAVILLTDGRRTIGPDPLDAARMAANHGVRVFTVGFGSSSGGNVDIDGMSIYMRFDEETLKGVAAITQAEYFHAGSGEELKKIYEGLNTRFALERKETEISALFAAIAALLAVTAAALSLAWFNRIV